MNISAEDEYQDDPVMGMPQWPNIVYNHEVTAEVELRIPDYLWFDSEEANEEIIMGLRQLAQQGDLLELGRNREFEYNYVRTTENAAMMLVLAYPMLKNWLEPIPRLKMTK